MKNNSVVQVTIRLFCIAIVTIILTTSFRSEPPTEPNVAFPTGYRNWTHIKTGYIGPQSPMFRLAGGYHHIYANEKALFGYETGNFPEGSILVFDVIDGTEENGNIKQGKRKHIDVMVKDGSKYATTGGWGYEEFSEGDHTKPVLTAEIKTNCFTCHSKQPDFVFSELNDAGNPVVYTRIKN
jgi:hypothetical protein